MHGFWRHPAVPVGIVLTVLGAGNWLVSRSKLTEYAERQQSSEEVAGAAWQDEFKRLTPRSNLTVLARLHPTLMGYDVIDAKRDFYAVVYRGGAVIAVAGVLLTCLGALQHWRDRRMRPPPPEPSSAPP